MNSKQARFIAAIALQLVIIFVIIIYKVAILTGGTEVLLRIRPVDPRDFLRGDYATFQYDISNVSSYLVTASATGGYSLRAYPTASVKNGDTVYIFLAKSGKYWVATRAQNTKPADGSGLYIKGRVVSGGQSSNGRLEPIDSGFGSPSPNGSQINITYGIEQYFIPEGSGRNMNLGQNGEAYARAAIDENGSAVIKQIYINDKPWP